MRACHAAFLLLTALISCQQQSPSNNKTKEPESNMDKISFESGYSEVNDLNMYYEIYGEGQPLVLVHGGGSTIESTFGRIIPQLAQNYRVIGVELQAHGHTADRDTAMSFAQSADDVAALLQNLNIPKAHFLGFSNGANVLMEMALRHPEKINKLILASTIYNRSGTLEQFWEGFDRATIDMLPPALKDAYLKANNNSEGLQRMFDRDVELMKNFKGWTDEQMKSISSPTLVINTTKDVGTVEHATEMYRLIPDAELVILPGGHGTYIGAIESLPDGEWQQSYTAEIIKQFLDK